MGSATLFTGQPGQLVRIKYESKAAPQVLQLAIDELPIGPGFASPKKILVTSMQLLENGNMQFQHTLDDSVYAYVFGDRIGSVRIGGLCFHAGDCVGTNSSSGFSEILQLYRANRAAARTTPLKVTVAGQVYNSLLASIQLTSEDAERNIGHWTLEFHTMPPKTFNT